MVENSVSVVSGVAPARARDIITDARLFEWHWPLGLNHVLLASLDLRTHHEHFTVDFQSRQNCIFQTIVTSGCPVLGHEHTTRTRHATRR